MPTRTCCPDLAARVRVRFPAVDVEVVDGRPAALPAAARSGMTTLRLVGSPWRTDTFQRLATRLEKIVGSKTAKQFEPLKIFTVGDLMRHVPRRYFSGTELSDLSLLREGEEVAVMAEVVDSRTFNLPVARAIGRRRSRGSRSPSPTIREASPALSSGNRD